MQHGGVAYHLDPWKGDRLEAAGLNRFDTTHHQTRGQPEQQVTSGCSHQHLCVHALFAGQSFHQAHHAPAHQKAPAHHQWDGTEAPVNRR